ncbi:MAG: flagellar assembly protein FliW [Clostridiales Family XIII bacterium]|jgi:flagellar assembly factor FliW|nr:flagellar assembly protein FliW [Clostridiales Family XIII bacterium]
MKINTRDFGVIEFDENAVYSFPRGVYGFEDVDSFVAFMHEEDGFSFVYLQAVKSQTPCFLVFSPWELLHAYAPEVEKDDLASLGVESCKDLIFLTIATVPPDDIRQLSINIKSPVVLNPKSMIGRQVILLNDDYPVKYYPFCDGKGCKDGEGGSRRKDGGGNDGGGSRREDGGGKDGEGGSRRKDGGGNDGYSGGNADSKGGDSSIGGGASSKNVGESPNRRKGG